MSSLIITNGDIAAERMREARINGQILCWRDILYEGPVPQTETLDELSAIRAEYLAYRGWGDANQIRQLFAERDLTIRSLARFSEVTLWFEHDLYDQLQLLQVLDLLAADPAAQGRCFLIQAGSLIGAETPQRLRMHLKLKQPVTEAQLALAQAAWSAYRAPSPERWAMLLRYDTSALPFLRVAVLRHLEEFPSAATGLTRTETFILRAIERGVHTPSELFAAFQEEEEAPYIGDWSFFAMLDWLASGAAPLIFGLNNRPYSPFFADSDREAYLASTLRLTALGVTTLLARKDAIAFRRLDRWLGGVHLTNGSCWRWDAENRRIVRPIE
jgi:hypothetical protein